MGSISAKILKIAAFFTWSGFTVKDLTISGQVSKILYGISFLGKQTVVIPTRAEGSKNLQNLTCHL